MAGRVDEPIDYWREVAGRGVVPLGFSIAWARGEPLAGRVQNEARDHAPARIRLAP